MINNNCWLGGNSFKYLKENQHEAKNEMIEKFNKISNNQLFTLK